MVKRNFDKWLTSFRASIATYDYYVNYDKVYHNVDDIKIELNILNSLIGSKCIEKDFLHIVNKYPEVLQCIPILLAVRDKEISGQDENGSFQYRFTSHENEKGILSPEQYAYFMQKTGLFELLSKRIIGNLLDYVTGVETGLDSNGRKNRGGHLMENLVEKYIQKAGFELNTTYFKEMYIHEITQKWGLDLSAISNQGKTEKRFDYVVRTENIVHGIETNFYASGGSTLNETARSYKTLALESKDIDGFTFIWFTDGKGWNSARHNLEETFDVLDHVYNIKDMEDGIMAEIFR